LGGHKVMSSCVKKMGKNKPGPKRATGHIAREVAVTLKA